MENGNGDDLLAPNALNGRQPGSSKAPAEPCDHEIGQERRTVAAHAGEDRSGAVWPLSEPIAPGSVYAYRDPALAESRRTADPPEPSYARDGLPNVLSLERAIAVLEEAEAAHATASGMAAIAMVFLAHLSANDHVVASTDCYCDTQRLLSSELCRFGVDVTFVDTTDIDAVRGVITPRTRLLFVETISNPTMQLADLSCLSAVAHGEGVILCVDSTFATPLLCRPLTLGADLVVHSATKFLGGHHDLSAGVVAGSREMIDPIRRCGYFFGPTLGPMDAWLALRGMKTLAPRIAWISETTLQVAEFLDAHPAVASVRYPGLASHPQAELAKRLLPNGMGGMLAFDLHGGTGAANTMIRSLRTIPYAMSLGGTTTTICYPPRDMTTGDAASCDTGDTVRLSVGLEAASDIIDDLRQSLARLTRTTSPVPVTEAVGAG